jgi:hypothetical protein
VIQDGYTTTVDVFNCGPNDGGKEPPVKKYPNTGIPPAAAVTNHMGSTAGIGIILAAGQVLVLASMAAGLRPRMAVALIRGKNR